MSDLDDLYDRRSRPLSRTLGGLAALITAAAGLLTVLTQAGMLQLNPTPAPMVIVPVVPTAQPATLPPVPTQPTGVTPETEQFVDEFLSGAVVAEILAYTYSDASFAAIYFTGDPLQSIQEAIADFQNQGVYAVPEFDVDQSYIADIRLVHDNLIEVDTCEVWSKSYYWLADDSFAESRPPHLVPQTITIEQFVEGWFITKVAFYNPPSFC